MGFITKAYFYIHCNSNWLFFFFFFYLRELQSTASVMKKCHLQWAEFFGYILLVFCLLCIYSISWPLKKSPQKGRWIFVCVLFVHFRVRGSKLDGLKRKKQWGDGSEGAQVKEVSVFAFAQRVFLLPNTWCISCTNNTVRRRATQ